MFEFLKKLFASAPRGFVQVRVPPSQKDLAETDPLIMEEAQERVLSQYPDAEAVGFNDDQYFTVKAGSELLCGWSKTEERAWIEAARRLAGTSIFAKKTKRK